MPTWMLVVADLAAGLALTTAGIVILIRRRERRVGVLLLASSVAWFAGTLWAPLVFLHRGPMVHLHLSYPTGRLRRWAALGATFIAYGWAIAEGWFDQPAITATLALVMAAAATDGYLHTYGPARRAGRAGFAAALLFAGILGISAVNRLLALRADTAIALAYCAVIVVIAVWLTLDLIRGRWTEETLADLLTHLSERPEDPDVEALLRRTIGDPGLIVGYWSADAGCYVDAAGRPVDSEGTQTSRIDDDHGRPLALLAHDPALSVDPALLEGAGAALRLVAINARLRTEIGARVHELAAARRRIIEVADVQHRALQAELSSGPERALAGALAALSSGAESDGSDRQQLISGIEDARDQLDRFARGLLPDSLETAGLSVAVERLAQRSSIPVRARIHVDGLDPVVASVVWFVCAEALTNAAKHADASEVHLEIGCPDGVVTVDVRDNGVGGADLSGTGLRGLVDRVTAVGGTLTVADADDGGTLVSARIPRSGTT
jgi:signal transduction histidine kinase